MSLLRLLSLPLLLLYPALGATTEADAMPGHIVEAFNEAHPEHAFHEAPRISPVVARVHHQGPGNDRRIALTFDACSTWEGTDRDPRIPELLRETKTPATLFLGGLWMAEFPELTRSLHRDPLFELGNHAWSHPDLTDMEADEVQMQLGLTQLKAKALTGEAPRWFRPPFVRKDATVVDAAASLGLETVQYDLASGDADEEASYEEIASDVLDRIRPGSIMVLHMNNPDLPTAQALPLILEGLEERDLEPVLLSELLAR